MGKSDRHRGLTSSVVRVVAWLCLAVTLAGCGGFVYSIRLREASAKLEEARELNAQELAPYEFYYAEQHLRKAREEAAEASYSDAMNFASTCTEYAERAIELSREAHRGAGR